VWHRAVELLGTVVVLGEWFIVLALPAHTSYRPMIALMSSALETCTRALRTCVTSCTGRAARFFFMLEARGPQGVIGHMAMLESTSAGRRGPEP
jgi:hypothetical protein